MQILVLGSCGFIGRNFVQYLVEAKIEGTIRCVDKNMRELSWLPKGHALFSCEFVQANLAQEAGRKKAFGDTKWDYVFNCAGEARLSQDVSVYEERVTKLSVECAKMAAAVGCKGFVEISDALVYNGKNSDESTGKLDPVTTIAKCKLEAEKQMKDIPNLNLVIVRPAICYGVGDQVGVMNRVVIGCVYKKLDEKMKLLWTEKTGRSTVHVLDVARAMWHVKDKKGEIYNLADEGNTTQESLSKIVADIYGIKYGFWGTLTSKAAFSVAPGSMTSTINEKHMQPWSDICQEEKIENTPLSPYLDAEILKDFNLQVSGAKITKLDFKYEKPCITKELVMEMVTSYIELGLFPKIS